MFSSIVEYFNAHTAAAIIQCCAIPSYIICFWFKKQWFLSLNIFTSALFAVGYILMSAWVGLCFAVLSASICILVYFLDKRENITGKNLISKRCIGLTVALVISLIVNIVFDKSFFSIVLTIGAGLNYYNYFFMKGNTVQVKIIFIASHFLIVIYEFHVLLYLFAIMDSIAALSIIGSLVFLCYKNHKTKNALNCIKLDCTETNFL